MIMNVSSLQSIRSEVVYTKVTFTVSKPHDKEFIGLPQSLETTFGKDLRSATHTDLVADRQPVARVDFADRADVQRASCGAWNPTGQTVRVCTVTLNGFMRKSVAESILRNLLTTMTNLGKSDYEVKWSLKARPAQLQAA